MEEPDENGNVYFTLGLGYDGSFIKLILVKSADAVQSPRVMALVVEACYTPLTSKYTTF